MTWMTTGPSFGAIVANAHTPLPKGRTRHLSPIELRHIVGAQFGGGDPGGGGGLTNDTSNPEGGGSSQPWQSPYKTFNAGNGNKQTELPIVGWKCRGGRLSVSLSLYHSSQSSRNAELGQKWSHSYDIYLTAVSSNPKIHWGDDTEYAFTPNVGGGYDSPAGIHDVFTLASGTSGTTSAVYSLTTKDQTVYTFSYLSGPAGWFCTSIADRNGNTITLSHDSSGNVTAITDPTSRAITLSYTSGKLTGISDPLSRSWVISYTGSDLTGVAFPIVGGTTTYSVSYGYNSAHDITSYTDLRGKTWTYTYNTSDNSLATETDPLSHSTSYAYTSSATTATDANSHTTVYGYSGGALVSVTDGLSHAESYSYDSDFNKTGVTDRRGHSWSYTFDSMGNMLTKTDPLSHTTTWTYDSQNNVTSVTTQLGHATSYAYDTNGNLTTTTDPLSHTKTYAYDSYGYGEVVSITDGLSHTTTMAYDSDGNCTAVTDPLSHATTTGFDGIGRVTSVTDATSKTTSTAYDELGRVVSITTPGSRTTSYTYDAGSDLKLTVTDPMAHVETYTYDNAGRCTSDENANSHTVSFGYDYVGNKTSFTDGNGHTTSYVYDANNRLTEVDYPANVNDKDTYTYLNDGSLSTKSDGVGRVITYAYDNANRLTGKSYSDGTISASYTYDNDDRKTYMSDGCGSTSYTYDDANRLTQRVQNPGTATTINFSYDAADRLSTRTYVGVGTTTFSYDNADRVTSVSNPGASGSESTSYTYDNAGRKLTTTFADGSVETDSYDSSTKDLIGVSHFTSGSVTISSYAYTYNSDGRKTSLTYADGSVVSYGYDAAGQLTSEGKVSSSSATLYSYAYTYDDAGNRLTKYDGTNTESYTYDDANKLLTAGTRTYYYDDAGNVGAVHDSVTGDNTHLHYDAEERMTVCYDDASVFSETYYYNGVDQRVAGGPPASTAYYVTPDDAINSPVLSDASALYNRGAGGDLVSEVRSGSSKFYHSDGHGSTGALTNVSGSTTDTLTTDAFGLKVTGSGSTPTPFGYAGQSGYRTDADTGLMLLGHRYYDSSTGRFLSRDPALAGYNWYTYCSNDPVNLIDSDGQMPAWVDRFFDTLGKAWTIPNSLLGAIGGIGGAFSYTDGPLPIDQGVTVVNGGWLAGILKQNNTPAMTLGDVIIVNDLSTFEQVHDHEMGHVQQYHIFGPFFLPIYGIGAILGKIRGDAHDANPFEWDADKQANIYNRYYKFDSW